MTPNLNEEIEAAAAKGVPPQYIASSLIAAGWPESLVNQAIASWRMRRPAQRTVGFRSWLARYRSRALPAVITMIAFGCISVAIILLKPWPTKIMIDSAFGPYTAPGPLAPLTGKPELILVTAILTIIIFLVGSAFHLLKNYTLLKLSFWLNRDIKEESFRHILHLPLYHQERLAKGDYVYRQNIVTNSLADYVLGTTASIGESVIMVISVLTVMLYFSVELTIISVILVPFLFVLIRMFGPPLGKIARESAEVASKTSAVLHESVDNAEAVQAYTLEEKQIMKANSLWQRGYELSKLGLFWGHAFRSVNSLLIILGTSAVMYFGGMSVLKQEITIGELLIFMTYMGYLLGPIEAIATQLAARKQKLVDVGRVHEIMSDHEGIEFLRQGIPFEPGSGKIEFQNVSYSYGDVSVLQGLNLTIEAGQKVAIIGPSGSGKTTIAKMLPLFIQPAEGRILVDGIDTQTVSLQQLRQKIAWIGQTPQLFGQSVLENILDGDVYRRPTEEEVREVMRVAHVDEFVAKMPMGVQTMVGEEGSTLSGGQRQRVSIARGLLKQAPILCMDEPTAALDSKSENYIRDALMPAMQGRTVLMITHRKSLLKLMDKIYVLDNGVLRDVNELGGIDRYLQKIEGEDNRQDAKAKRFEHLIDEYIQYSRQRNRRIAESLESWSAASPDALGGSPPFDTDS